MAAEGGSSGGGGGEETASVSPTYKVKFLCSHGGKILPRPTDGHLKYVGGETRVIAVPRDINFSELMKKLTTVCDGEMVLKYQLIPEDLDALITVRTDEDLRHMLDEYDRQESVGIPKLRAFLFPSNPIVVENQMASMDPHAVEQRYIDAVNGFLRTNRNLKLTSINAYRRTFSISSTCSSPRNFSPEKRTHESMNQETVSLNGYQSSQVHMHKVQSSPSLCGLNDYQHHNNNHMQHHHYYHQNHHHHHGYQSYRPPQDPHKSGGAERLVSTLKIGRGETLRGQMGQGPDHYYSVTRHHIGCGSCNRFGNLDQYGAHGFRRFDRGNSLPQSPRSPRKAPWE
ncbi:hypothetical protein L1049_015666 [Liquidambar formosana]|uniref:PB1 domain-containing protein n=1 Tax=Liquidambar formosana TaxID=63359 RepID=A0AAP0RY96_LIQFO